MGFVMRFEPLTVDSCFAKHLTWKSRTAFGCSADSDEYEKAIPIFATLHKMCVSGRIEGDPPLGLRFVHITREMSVNDGDDTYAILGTDSTLRVLHKML